MSDLKLGIVFDVKSGKFKSEVKQNTQTIQQFGNSSVRTASQTRQLSSSLDNTNNKLIATNRVAQSVTHAIGGLAAGFGALQLGQGLVKELAAFQDIRTRLQGLSDSSADYAAKERWLIDLATEHHKELNGLADGYSRLSTLTKEKIITDGQARNMLEGLSNAASQNGASNADLERVYYGLSQALGAGTVNMEDFKQVTEPLPDLMAKISRAAGQETSAGLKQLIGTGTYTSEVFGKHLVTALQDYAGASAKTADNINAKYRDIKREYQLLAVQLEQPINSALLPTLDGLTEGLSFLKEHTEGVITVLQGGLVVAAGHATNAIITKTSATAKTIIASRASAIAAKTQAISEYDLAVAYKASAVGSVQNAIADKRLIITRKALTVATRTASVATRALSGSMALLGGPIGVAMLAAFAVGTYAMSAADGARESTNLANQVSLADKKLTELTTKQLRLRLFDLENDPAAEIDKARLRALKAQEEYNKAQASRGFKNPNKESEKTALDRDVEIEALEVKLAKAKVLKQKIKNILVTPSSSADSNKKPSSKPAPIDKNLGKDLASVEQSLLDKEGVINASYVRQQSIVDNSLASKLISEEKYNTLSIQLDAKKDLALKALSDQKLAQEKEQAESKATAVQKMIDDEVQAKLNARELLDQQRRDAWGLELAELQGHHSLKEAEEAAHNERVISMKTRKTGDMQDTLMQFANFEKKTQLEKTSAVIGIGEYGFKAMAGQSKKAFAMYKAFSIGQALIKTYEAATGAYAALAPIPVVGPALGVAAAAAAVASGLGQVNQIKSQQPPGYYHGGNIGGNNIIEFGERNKPEVLEFEGKNYLLGGNGGAVFNRSQLSQVPRDGSGGTNNGRANITVNLIEDAARAGQVSQNKGLNGEDVIRIFVADIRQGGDSADAMELTYGVQRTGT